MRRKAGGAKYGNMDSLAGKWGRRTTVYGWTEISGRGRDCLGQTHWGITRNHKMGLRNGKSALAIRGNIPTSWNGEHPSSPGAGVGILLLEMFENGLECSWE